MKRWALGATLVLFHQFHGEDASACGVTLDVIESVLPPSDAAGVPLDAALVAATNGRAISAMMLRRVDDAVEKGARGQRDAGATPTLDAALEEAGAGESGALDVEVRVECYQGPGGYVCIGTPSSTLLPNTTYEWFASMERSGAPLITESRRFTTGTNIAETGNPEVRVSLTGYERENSHPCGRESVARVAISAAGLMGPLVVHALPTAAVLTPSAAEQSVVLYNISECSTLKGFDVTGRQLELGDVCPEDMGVGMPAAGEPSEPVGAGEQPTADHTAPSDGAGSSQDESNDGEAISRRSVASDTETGCAVSRGAIATRSSGDGGAQWLLAALACLAAVGWRRRGWTSPAGASARR